MIPIALTAAGSDPSGGAGIQADLKTFSRLKVYGMSVVTALTAQNTTGVAGVFEISADFVGLQWDAVMNDIAPTAIKTGMLGSPAIVEVVASKIQESRVAKVVVDPVLKSSTGTPLLHKDALRYLKHGLAPLALLITPNLEEAAALVGFEVQSPRDMEEAALRIRDMGPKNVLVKGGHLDSADAPDVLFDGRTMHYLRAPRLERVHLHGTGCVLSAAITAFLALGFPLEESVRLAKNFVTESIRNSLAVGKGRRPCNPAGVAG